MDLLQCLWPWLRFSSASLWLVLEGAVGEHLHSKSSVAPRSRAWLNSTLCECQVFMGEVGLLAGSVNPGLDSHQSYKSFG